MRQLVRFKLSIGHDNGRVQGMAWLCVHVYALLLFAKKLAQAGNSSKIGAFNPDARKTHILGRNGPIIFKQGYISLYSYYAGPQTHFVRSLLHSSKVEVQSVNNTWSYLQSAVGPIWACITHPLGGLGSYRFSYWLYVYMAMSRTVLDALVSMWQSKGRK